MSFAFIQKKTKQFSILSNCTKIVQVTVLF